MARLTSRTITSERLLVRQLLSSLPRRHRPSSICRSTAWVGSPPRHFGRRSSRWTTTRRRAATIRSRTAVPPAAPPISPADLPRTSAAAFSPNGVRLHSLLPSRAQFGQVGAAVDLPVRRRNRPGDHRLPPDSRRRPGQLCRGAGRMPDWRSCPGLQEPARFGVHHQAVRLDVVRVGPPGQDARVRVTLSLHPPQDSAGQGAGLHHSQRSPASGYQQSRREAPGRPVRHQ